MSRENPASATMTEVVPKSNTAPIAADFSSAPVHADGSQDNPTVNSRFFYEKDGVRMETNAPDLAQQPAAQKHFLEQLGTTDAPTESKASTSTSAPASEFTAKLSKLADKKWPSAYRWIINLCALIALGGIVTTALVIGGVIIVPVAGITFTVLVCGMVAVTSLAAWLGLNTWFAGLDKGYKSARDVDQEENHRLVTLPEFRRDLGIFLTVLAVIGLIVTAGLSFGGVLTAWTAAELVALALVPVGVALVGADLWLTSVGFDVFLKSKWLTSFLSDNQSSNGNQKSWYQNRFLLVALILLVSAAAALSVFTGLSFGGILVGWTATEIAILSLVCVGAMLVSFDLLVRGLNQKPQGELTLTQSLPWYKDKANQGLALFAITGLLGVSALVVVGLEVAGTIAIGSAILANPIFLSAFIVVACVACGRALHLYFQGKEEAHKRAETRSEPAPQTKAWFSFSGLTTFVRGLFAQQTSIERALTASNVAQATAVPDAAPTQVVLTNVQPIPEGSLEGSAPTTASQEQTGDAPESCIVPAVTQSVFEGFGIFASKPAAQPDQLATGSVVPADDVDETTPLKSTEAPGYGSGNP